MDTNFIRIQPYPMINKVGNSLPGTSGGGEIDGDLSPNHPKDATVILRFENNNFKVNDSIINYYTIFEAGRPVMFKTTDSTSELAKFKTTGLALITLIFSAYLYFVATKLYRRYYAKGNSEIFVDFFCAFFTFFSIVAWCLLVLIYKQLPDQLFFLELLNYPSQFALGIILPSYLLLGVGIFRFVIIGSIYIPEKTEKSINDMKISFIGLFFGAINLIASIIGIWSAIK